MDHSPDFAQCSDCRLQASTIIRHHPTVEQVREQFDAITDGLRTNSDGQLFAVIHQYDHHPSLVEAYHKWHSIISDGAINLNGINSHSHQQLPNEKQIKDATIAKMCRRIHQPNASLSTLVKSWAWTVRWNASKTSRRRIHQPFARFWREGTLCLSELPLVHIRWLSSPYWYRN